jgi:hypothetical protein
MVAAQPYGVAGEVDCLQYPLPCPRVVAPDLFLFLARWRMVYWPLRQLTG